MKKPSPRYRHKPTYTTRHQLEDVAPTVIHDPEKKMTALARLTHHAMQDPRGYLAWPVAIVATVLVALGVWNLVMNPRSTTSEVWSKVEAAKGPSERVDLAKEYPESPAATWALLQAATEYYNQALADLPHNREVARPTLKKALDLFDRVAREAPRDSVQARAAALGKAQTLEARSELDKAIEQYQLVAQTWPETPEADQARHFVEVLKDPQADAFYKELYTYSPTKVTLPPFSSETLPSSPLGPLGPLANPGTGSLPSSPLGPLTPVANPSSPKLSLSSPSS
jgi:hypothetical protein